MCTKLGYSVTALNAGPRRCVPPSQRTPTQSCVPYRPILRGGSRGPAANEVVAMRVGDRAVKRLRGGEPPPKIPVTGFTRLSWSAPSMAKEAALYDRFAPERISSTSTCTEHPLASQLLARGYYVVHAGQLTKSAQHAVQERVTQRRLERGLRIVGRPGVATLDVLVVPDRLPGRLERSGHLAGMPRVHPGAA